MVTTKGEKFKEIVVENFQQLHHRISQSELQRYLLYFPNRIGPCPYTMYHYEQASLQLAKAQ
jgi:hypothetical protein